MYKRLLIRTGSPVLTLLMFFSILSFFALIGNRSIADLPVRLYADADKYVDFARSDAAALIAVGQNYFGPVILLRLLGSNVLVHFFNVLLLWYSYNLAISYSKNSLFIAIVLFANPMMWVSLLLVNKEILGVAGIMAAVDYLHSRRKLSMVLAILLGLFARWQQVFVFALVFMLTTRPIQRRISLSTLFWLLLLGASVAFPLFSARLPRISLVSQASTGGGIAILMNQLQERFLYFIVFWPKTLFNVAGNVPRALSVLLGMEDSPDLYNGAIISAHQIAMMVLSIVYISQLIKRRFDKVDFLIATYALVFSLSPIIQYRYFFPIYVALAMQCTRFGLRRRTYMEPYILPIGFHGGADRALAGGRSISTPDQRMR